MWALLVLELAIELEVGDANVAVAVDLYVVGGPPKFPSCKCIILELRNLALCTFEGLYVGTISSSIGPSMFSESPIEIFSFRDEPEDEADRTEERFEEWLDGVFDCSLLSVKIAPATEDGNFSVDEDVQSSPADPDTGFFKAALAMVEVDPLRERLAL